MAFEILQVNTGVVAAGTDNTYILGTAPTTMAQGSWTPTKLSMTSPTTVTGATATQLVFTFKSYRAAVDQGTFATLTTATGTDLTALTERTLAITAGTTFQAGDVIAVAMTHSSTGTGLPAGLLIRMELQ